MIFDRIEPFLDFARRLPAAAPACARGAFLLAPEGMTLAAQSAADNAYMDLERRIDAERALAQHRGLQRALSAALPTVCFAGDPATPDAVFPNNVFATARVAGEARGRFLVGRMRHPVRQREAERADIHGFFEDLLGYRRIDLRAQPGTSELTGTLVIDRSRGLGFAGLSPRCDRAGVEAMHAAFGLRATFCFALAEGEYHTNVALSVLAGRALVIAPEALVDPALVEPLGSLFEAGVIRLERAEQLAFAGNCIALEPGRAWMSQAAVDGLREASRAAFERAGFAIGAVPLDEIEKAGGSLRCCVGEIF